MLSAEHINATKGKQDLEATIFALAQALEPTGVGHLMGEYVISSQRATITKIYASFNAASYFLIAQRTDDQTKIDILNVKSHGSPKILACFKHLNRMRVEHSPGKRIEQGGILQSIESVFKEASTKFKIDASRTDTHGDFYVNLKDLVIEIEKNSSNVADTVTFNNHPTHRNKFR